MDGVQEKLSGFDQKAFIQIRLHELLSNIDKLSFNPLLKNYDYGVYNYIIIKNNLFCVYQTIYSKLSDKEKPSAKLERSKLREVIKLKVYSKINNNGMVITKFDEQNWELISEEINDFRCLLEDLMDAHGFNPSKDDVSKSIIKM